MTIATRLSLKSPSTVLLRRVLWAPVYYLALTQPDKRRAQALVERELVTMRDQYLYPTAAGRELMT